MLISKNHLRARHAVSKDDSRPLLQVIDIKKIGDEVVAASTDGYILTEIRETTPDPDDFPNINGRASIDEVRISGKTAAKLATTLKGNKTVPILDFGNVTSDGVIATDLMRSTIFHDNQVEGHFPDYKQLIPDSKNAVATVHLNPAFLASVLKAFDGVGSILLELHGPMQPVVLHSVEGDADITGVVMPLKA